MPCLRRGQCFILLFALWPHGSQAVDVTWTSPTNGTSYEAGESITGQWQSPEGIISPSFKLCAYPPGAGDDDENCGSTVWPAVQQDGDTYYVTLAAPNVTSTSEFCLQMVDDTGNTSLSPQFSLSPVASASSDLNSPSPAPRVFPSLLESRMPFPTAAYAVPLSLVGIVLLLALGACLHHHRRRRRHHHLSPKSDASDSDSKCSFDFTSLSRTPSVAVSQRSARTPDRCPGGTLDKPSPDEKDIFTAVYVPTLSRTHPTPTSTSPRAASRNVRVGSKAAATVPASLFKAVSSPVTRSQSQFDAEGRDEGGANAAATHSVVSHYLHPSPVPPSLSVPSDPIRPEHAHVRKSALLEGRATDRQTHRANP